MSDTPRTEAMIDSCGDYEKAYHYNGRFAEFSRKLERELNAQAETIKSQAEEIERMRPVVEAASEILMFGSCQPQHKLLAAMREYEKSKPTDEVKK